MATLTQARHKCEEGTRHLNGGNPRLAAEAYTESVELIRQVYEQSAE